MKELFLAEFEYFRRRVIFAVVWGGAPLFLLAGVLDPILGGRVPFDEPGFLSLTFFWSILPALALFNGSRGAVSRCDARTGLHMTLPISRWKVGLVHQTIASLGYAAAVTGCVLSVFMTGVSFPVEEQRRIWLSNAFFIGFTGEFILMRHANRSKYAIKALSKIFSAVLFVFVVLALALGDLLIVLLQDAGQTKDLLVRYVAWSAEFGTNPEGILYLNLIACGLWVLSLLHFSLREKFVGK